MNGKVRLLTVRYPRIKPWTDSSGSDEVHRTLEHFLIQPLYCGMPNANYIERTDSSLIRRGGAEKELYSYSYPFKVLRNSH